MLFHIEPKTCPSLWGTPAEECRARLHNGPDARRSCICRHTRYRGTPPEFYDQTRSYLDQGHPWLVLGVQLQRCGQRVSLCLVLADTRRKNDPSEWPRIAFFGQGRGTRHG